MSFAFNFATDSKKEQDEIDDGSKIRDDGAAKDDGDDSGEKISSSSSSVMIPSSSSFSWFSDDEVRSMLHQPIDYDYSDVVISRTLEKGSNNDDQSVVLRHVKEGSAPSTSSATDLVPGVYEGGMKVWECSIDLCQWLNDNSDILPKQGHVLELGCGHGLPGCWVISNAIRKSYQQQQRFENEQEKRQSPIPPPRIDISVCWSDYNKFCLEGVTLPNVLLNIQDVLPPLSHERDTYASLVASWLTKALAFGAGDWNVMSNELLEEDDRKCAEGQQKKKIRPSALPENGKFDLILAAETTYTETAAKDTAKIVARHLIPGTGIAIIATKRYYFGVGGGSNCFCQTLESFEDDVIGHTFHVETARVFDDGVSNIRELLLVKSIALS